jgi:hypothetical protein
MTGEGDISEEINEAKELMASVMVKLEPFSDLWGCRETVRDGECEYGCEFFVKAGNLEEAERKAWEKVHSNYDTEEERQYPDFINEDGWMEISSDYRLIQAEVSRQIHDLDELFQFVNYSR